MSRTGRGGYRNRGTQGRGAGGAGKGGSTAPTSKEEPKPKGACAELGSHVFDYGTTEAAEQMMKTWEAIEVYVGKEFGEDMRNELRTGKETVIPVPQLPETVRKAQDKKKEAAKAKTNRLLGAKQLALAATKASLLILTLAAAFLAS